MLIYLKYLVLYSNLHAINKISLLINYYLIQLNSRISFTQI